MQHNGGPHEGTGTIMLPPVMVSPSQRLIYDERYRSDGYDSRSEVRVLTAEFEALIAATNRAVASVPHGPVALMDFGYGTGRVTNEFIDWYQAGGGPSGRDLRVYAYDVSSVGLSKAADRLVRDQGFVASSEPTWCRDGEETYVAGILERTGPCGDASLVLVHAGEGRSANEMTSFVLDHNAGPVLLTTSWYSGLGHIPGRSHRHTYFTALGELTHPRGEVLVAVSSKGDLDREQLLWDLLRKEGELDSTFLGEDGDVMYETELGQENYWHLFGEDLLDHMRDITGEGQRCWIEGIRVPGDEFTCKEEEQANLRAVQDLNRRLEGTAWQDEDYRSFHTVLAVRSGYPEGARTTLGG